MSLKTIHFSAPVKCAWKVKSIVAMAFALIERLFVTEKAIAQTISMRGKFCSSIAISQFFRYFGNGNFS